MSTEKRQGVTCKHMRAMLREVFLRVLRVFPPPQKSTLLNSGKCPHLVLCAKYILTFFFSGRFVGRKQFSRIQVTLLRLHGGRGV